MWRYTDLFILYFISIGWPLGHNADTLSHQGHVRAYRSVHDLSHEEDPGESFSYPTNEEEEAENDFQGDDDDLLFNETSYEEDSNEDLYLEEDEEPTTIKSNFSPSHPAGVHLNEGNNQDEALVARNLPLSFDVEMEMEPQDVEILTANQIHATVHIERDVIVDLMEEMKETSDWSEWLTWSTCSKSCGSGGVRTRRRGCNIEAGDVCWGADVETSACPTQLSCHLASRPYAYTGDMGHWGEWSHWSECSISCGQGVERQRRPCITPEEGTSQSCTGIDRRQRHCIRDVCSSNDMSSGVNAVEGHNMRLHCSYDQSFPIIDKYWVVPGGYAVREGHENSRYTVEGDYLYVNHAESHDQGTYHCVVTRPDTHTHTSDVNLHIMTCSAYNVCLNGGTCIEEAQTVEHPFANVRCECPTPYTGEFCQKHSHHIVYVCIVAACVCICIIVLAWMVWFTRGCTENTKDKQEQRESSDKSPKRLKMPKIKIKKMWKKKRKDKEAEFIPMNEIVGSPDEHDDTRPFIYEDELTMSRLSNHHERQEYFPASFSELVRRSLPAIPQQGPHASAASFTEAVNSSQGEGAMYESVPHMSRNPFFPPEPEHTYMVPLSPNTARKHYIEQSCYGGAWRQTPSLQQSGSGYYNSPEDAKHRHDAFEKLARDSTIKENDRSAWMPIHKDIIHQVSMKKPNQSEEVPEYLDMSGFSQGVYENALTAPVNSPGRVQAAIEEINSISVDADGSPVNPWSPRQYRPVPYPPNPPRLTPTHSPRISTPQSPNQKPMKGQQPVHKAELKHDVSPWRSPRGPHPDDEFVAVGANSPVVQGSPDQRSLDNKPPSYFNLPPPPPPPQYNKSSPVRPPLAPPPQYNKSSPVRPPLAPPPQYNKSSPVRPPLVQNSIRQSPAQYNHRIEALYDLPDGSPRPLPGLVKSPQKLYQEVYDTVNSPPQKPYQEPVYDTVNSPPRPVTGLVAETMQNIATTRARLSCNPSGPPPGSPGNMTRKQMQEMLVGARMRGHLSDDAATATTEGPATSPHQVPSGGLRRPGSPLTSPRKKLFDTDTTQNFNNHNDNTPCEFSDMHSIIVERVGSCVCGVHSSECLPVGNNHAAPIPEHHKAISGSVCSETTTGEFVMKSEEDSSSLNRTVEDDNLNRTVEEKLDAACQETEYALTQLWTEALESAFE